MYNKAFSLFINLSFLFIISFYIISSSTNQFSLQNLISTSGNCNVVCGFSDNKSKCLYVKSHSSCWSKGYFNYLEIFYCTCSNSVVLGYLVLSLWLVILFYVLGNTTAEYFIPSIEGLSNVLKLSPTIAGTTLLPFGNGANDVFSSIISFTRSGDGDVGLNSVLGGALFITCFVVGILSISISSRRIRVNESSFIRDIVFYLFTLCSLLLIIIFGKVNIWFAVGFVSIYFLYIAVVSFMQYFCTEEEIVVNPLVIDELSAMKIPLLGYVDEERGLKKDGLFRTLEHKSATDHMCNFVLYDVDVFKYVTHNCGTDDQLCQKPDMEFHIISCRWFLYILELPLYLPRRLTIPIVSEGKWSKPFAIISSTLAPILLATLWNTRRGKDDAKGILVIYSTAIFIGIVFGISTLFLTKNSGPPKRFRFPFPAAGFLMSITWTYIVVQELVSLLIAFGNILGISPSLLGLTVLAWGNSVGDLISNLALALKCGADGAQVAMSGCYAGPLFNTLVGLGLSLVFEAWDKYPDGFMVPRDSDLYETVGFLMLGLLWALVILLKRNMELDKWLGVGLLSIYFCFLFLRLVKSVGLVNL